MAPKRRAEMLIERPNNSKDSLEKLITILEEHEEDLGHFCEHVGNYTMVNAIDPNPGWVSLKAKIKLLLDYTVWLVTEEQTNGHERVVYEHTSNGIRGRVIYERFVDGQHAERDPWRMT